MLLCVAHEEAKAHTMAKRERSARKRVWSAPWVSAECCIHLLSRRETLRMRSVAAPSTSHGGEQRSRRQQRRRNFFFFIDRQQKATRCGGTETHTQAHLAYTHLADTHTHTLLADTHTHTLWTQQTTNALRCCASLCCAIGIGCAIDIGIASKLMRSVVTLLLRCRRRAKRFPHSSVCLHCARQTMRCAAMRWQLSVVATVNEADATRCDAPQTVLQLFALSMHRTPQQPAASRTLSSPSPALPFPLVFVVAIGLVRIDQVQAEWAFAKGGAWFVSCTCSALIYAAAASTTTPPRPLPLRSSHCSLFHSS